jgi:serine/threonine-protein kinase
MAFGFEAGTTIGGTYRVVDLIGRGGMGVVLRAHDGLLERDVAIKVIRPDLLDDHLRERFLTEARAMARVCHPNVLPIYAFGEHEGAPYFVTQIARGQTVEAWLRARDPRVAPDLDVAFSILEDTCRGVAAIHAARTVHRDIKPSNLLLDPDFGVCVADMGVAALVRGESRDAWRDIVGTPEYLAPECALQVEIALELAHRADVYSLGCLAFELLTGSTPFAGKRTALACMVAHASELPPRPSSRRPDLSPELDAAILAALVKDPLERTPSAVALWRALDAARSSTREPVRILVAEDDDDLRDALAASLHLEFPDASVETVSDGREALEAFARRAPSVALLDLNMPKIDGIQLTELLRRSDGGCDVPIVVMTGSGGSREWRHLSELGADGFLVKPVHQKDVTTLLRRVLADRARGAPLAELPMEPSADEDATLNERRRVPPIEDASGPRPIDLSGATCAPEVESKAG